MGMENYVLLKKNVCKWIKPWFVIVSLSGKDSPWSDSSGKKKFQTQLSVKKMILTVSWYMKWGKSIDFLEKKNITVASSLSKKRWHQTFDAQFFFSKKKLNEVRTSYE